jgi:predicted transcriptional regulator
MHDTELDRLLRRHRLTEAELERRGGPPPSTLRGIKQGRRPHLPTIDRIARAVGCDVVAVREAVLATAANARKGGQR